MAKEKSYWDEGPVRVAVVGYGAIGKAVADTLAADPNFSLIAICARNSSFREAERKFPGKIVVRDLIATMDLGPDIVIEAAGHNVLIEWGEAILRRGIDLLAISIGAFAEMGSVQKILNAAKDGQSRIYIPAGAFAGFDGLLALQEKGLRVVEYCSIKPSLSWCGTIAESEFELDALTEATIIFEGNAREAASRYPKNANLAAAVALAGIGFEDTNVRLVADPAATEITTILVARCEDEWMKIETKCSFARDNPKSSAIVANSIYSSLKNRANRISFS